MEIIEIFIYACIAVGIVFCTNAVNKARPARVSHFFYSGLILALIITQIFLQISPDIRGQIHPLIYISIGGILALALIYFLIRSTVTSLEVRENAHTWIVWTMFLVLAISSCLLLAGLFDSQAKDLFGGTRAVHLLRIPLGLALCLSIAYYPPAFDKLTASESTAGESPEETEGTVADPTTEEVSEVSIEATPEPSIEEQKETLINLAIESWRFAKVFERMLIEVNVDQPKRYTSQLRWFIKKTEESLEEIGLRIANIEGHPYDPGMAATPVNIADFEVDDALEVDLMIEPIIMEGKTLAKTGKVTLRKIEL